MTDEFVKAMRAQPTDAEHRLWQRLRRKQVGGLRFRRQYRLGLYIVDFVCLPARLVVEVDGGQHAVETQKDGRRTRWLETQGFTVVRFWNNDVLENTEGVVEAIHGYLAEIQRYPPSPRPLPQGEGVTLWQAVARGTTVTAVPRGQGPPCPPSATR